MGRRTPKPSSCLKGVSDPLGIRGAGRIGKSRQRPSSSCSVLQGISNCIFTTGAGRAICKSWQGPNPSGGVPDRISRRRARRRKYKSGEEVGFLVGISDRLLQRGAGSGTGESHKGISGHLSGRGPGPRARVCKSWHSPSVFQEVSERLLGRRAGRTIR